MFEESSIAASEETDEANKIYLYNDIKKNEQYTPPPF